MHITEIITLQDTLRAFVIASVLLFAMKRFGAIHSYLHPITPTLFQGSLTVGLLGLTIIPFGHVLAFLLLYGIVCFGAKRPHSPSRSEVSTWDRAMPWIIALSVVVNLYLLFTKGFLLLNDDVGTARQEFYQGLGLFQRFNSICAIVLGAHWARSFIEDTWLRPAKLALLVWVTYIFLTLGSKSGLLTLLTFIGAATYFAPAQISAKKLAVPIVLAVLSIMGMFFVFYGIEAAASFAVRFISFADGPFYFFGFDQPLQVSISYPLQQLMVALRLSTGLPEASLGPAINLQQFGFDNELFGPNPQVFVESVAIFGPVMYPLYYLLVGAMVVFLLRSARSVYSLCLYSMIAGPMLVDSQFAFSNVFNLMIAIALRLAFGNKLLPRIHVKRKAAHRLSRVQ
jgi:hypothetical protein